MKNFNFTKQTQCFFYNRNPQGVQNMLDYDYAIHREIPSVAGIISPTSRNKFEKFFLGTKEIIIPIYNSIQEAIDNHRNVEILVNFASSRSAHNATIEALNKDHFKIISIVAEGIPERLSREMKVLANQKETLIIGPATVGFIVPGKFKSGNIGGLIENIIQSKLNRPGNVGLITRSGGLCNGLCNTIAQNSNGVAEAVAIGGDRFIGSAFLEHALRMEQNPDVKLITILGEVGGSEEYRLIQAIKDKKITKPVIGYCIGSSNKNFGSEIQFGHAGASANSKSENAEDKNLAMKEAGIHVPDSFDGISTLVKKLSEELNLKDTQVDLPELKTNKELKQNRMQTNFVCTISDDRGEEATYNKVPISDLALPDTGYSIGDTITLLWFKQRYPKWASEFIESCIKTLADHGPAVSGAHNAKVTARAGKDLISSLASGLLTIGPRFGGAIDGAALHFKRAHQSNQTPLEFVEDMKSKGIFIPGIGHKIKSIHNPDKRVQSLIEYARQNFPTTNQLDYALEVEKITTAKKPNLILNVDGVIANLMIDMWTSLGYTSEQIDEMIKIGTLNGFFALSRSIGFIGHILDEKRLQMPLYRHPTDDILYQ